MDKPNTHNTNRRTLLRTGASIGLLSVVGCTHTRTSPTPKPSVETDIPIAVSYNTNTHNQYTKTGTDYYPDEVDTDDVFQIDEIVVSATERLESDPNDMWSWQISEGTSYPINIHHYITESTNINGMAIIGPNPLRDTVQGDIWINWNKSEQKTDYFPKIRVLIHEMAHALGYKHRDDSRFVSIASDDYEMENELTDSSLDIAQSIPWLHIIDWSETKINTVLSDDRFNTMSYEDIGWAYNQKHNTGHTKDVFIEQIDYRVDTPHGPRFFLFDNRFQRTQFEHPYSSHEDKLNK